MIELPAVSAGKPTLRRADEAECAALRLVPHRSGQEGFTLVELLVVVSIVALLISLLLPALDSAREMAIRSMCASTQRQLTIATIVYTNDEDGELPGTSSYHDHALFWAKMNPADPDDTAGRGFVALYPGYIREPQGFYCPASIIQAFEPDWIPWFQVGHGGREREIGYFYLANRVEYFGEPVPRTIDDPGGLPLWADRLEGEQPPPFHLYRRSNHPAFYNVDHTQVEGTNVGHLDGSVAWRDGTQIQIRHLYFGGYGWTFNW